MLSGTRKAVKRGAGLTGRSRKRVKLGQGERIVNMDYLPVFERNQKDMLANLAGLRRFLNTTKPQDINIVIPRLKNPGIMLQVLNLAPEALGSFLARYRQKGAEIEGKLPSTRRSDLRKAGKIFKEIISSIATMPPELTYSVFDTLTGMPKPFIKKFQELRNQKTEIIKKWDEHYDSKLRKKFKEVYATLGPKFQGKEYATLTDNEKNIADTLQRANIFFGSIEKNEGLRTYNIAKLDELTRKVIRLWNIIHQP